MRNLMIPLLLAAAVLTTIMIPSVGQTAGSTRVFTGGALPTFTANTSLRRQIGLGPIGFNPNVGNFGGPLSLTFNGQGPLAPFFNGVSPIAIGPNFGGLLDLRANQTRFNVSGPLAFPGQGSTFSGPDGSFVGTGPLNATKRIDQIIGQGGVGFGGAALGSGFGYYGPNAFYNPNTGYYYDANTGLPLTTSPVSQPVTTADSGVPASSMGDTIGVQRGKDNTVRLAWHGDARNVASIVFAVLDKNGKAREQKRVTKLPATVVFNVTSRTAYYEAAVTYVNGSMRRFVSKL